FSRHLSSLRQRPHPKSKANTLVKKLAKMQLLHRKITLSTGVNQHPESLFSQFTVRDYTCMPPFCITRLGRTASCALSRPILRIDAGAINSYHNKLLKSSM